jgi:hypothetical protein
VGSQALIGSTMGGHAAALPASGGLLTTADEWKKTMIEKDGDDVT